MEPWGRRRPSLYADIPGPVLQVPAGEKGGSGCLPNILQQNDMEEDEEDKMEADTMRRRWMERGGVRRICRTAWWWRQV